MNYEVIVGSSDSATYNRHFTRMSNQGDLLRSMVLDINNISYDELLDIFPTTQGIS
jgi:hypothetical protein